jgi:hypothetical protein
VERVVLIGMGNPAHGHALHVAVEIVGKGPAAAVSCKAVGGVGVGCRGCPDNLL